MKVTTELKNLIKTEFANKRAKVKAEIKLNRETVYKAELEKLNYNKTFNEIKSLMAKLYDEYAGKYIEDGHRWDKTTSKDIAYITSKFKEFKNLKPSDLLGDNSYYLERLEEGQDKIAELKKQEQSLLIKLTYEKDLDVIKQMLAEYDINIL